jgi:hypothetical protein
VFADVRVQMPAGSDTVYVTKSGDHYHRQGCASLRESSLKTNRKDAEKLGYRSCGKCKP